MLVKIKNAVNFFSYFVLLLLLSFLPLARFSIFDFDFEFSKFAVLLILGSFLFLLNGVKIVIDKAVLPSKKILILIAGFFLVYLISTFFSISRTTSLLGYYSHFTGGLVYIAILLIVFYTAFCLRKERKNILITIFLSGLAVSFYGLWQYAQNYFYHKEIIFRIYSTIGQPNRLAFYLLAVIPLGIFLWAEEKNRVKKIIYTIGNLTIFLAFFLTFSRTSYLVLLLIGFCIFKQFNNKKLLLNKYFLVPVFCGFLLFGFIFARSIPSTINNYQNSSLALRMAEWQGSISAIINRNLPRQIFGYGPETVYFTFFKYKPIIYNSSYEEQNVGPGQIRNYYLQLLSGIGILGLGFYLFLVTFIITRLKAVSEKNNLTNGIYFSLVGIMLLSFFYYQTDTVLLIFWTLLGLAITDEEKISNIFVKIKGIFLILISMGLFVLSGKIIYADYKATQGYLDQAIATNPYFDVYLRNKSRFYYQTMLSEKDKGENISQVYYSPALISAREALNINPVDIRNIRQLLLVQYLGGAYINKSFHQNNLELSDRLVDLSPNEALNWDLRGLVYLDLNKLEVAKKSFLTEVSLTPNSPGVYLHLGEAVKQQGNLTEAIKYYQKAIELAPTWDFARNELEKAEKLLLQK